MLSYLCLNIQSYKSHPESFKTILLEITFMTVCRALLSTFYCLLFYLSRCIFLVQVAVEDLVAVIRKHSKWLQRYKKSDVAKR